MNTVHICSLIIKAASVLAGLAVYANQLPAKWAAIAAIAFGAASFAKDLALQIGDLADDGVDNDSFQG